MPELYDQDDEERSLFADLDEILKAGHLSVVREARLDPVYGDDGGNGMLEAIPLAADWSQQVLNLAKAHRALKTSPMDSREDATREKMLEAIEHILDGTYNTEDE